MHRHVATGGGGRFARWRGGWALALRVPRRDARAHRDRSLLIVAMVALPVLVLVAGIVAVSSTRSTPLATLGQTMGAASARVNWSDHRIEQDFVAGSLAYRDQAVPLPGVDVGAPPSRADLERLAGGRLVPVTSARGFFADGHGNQAVLGVDGRDPVAAGMVRLVSGRLPEREGEAVVTPYAVKQGVRPEGELRFRVEGRAVTVRVVGVAEGWTSRGTAAFVVTLPQTFAGTTPTDAYGSSVAEGNGYLLDRPTPVSWADVRRMNEHGLSVLSRAVVTDPPPRSELPASLQTWATPGDSTLGLVVLGSTALLLETMLLAGPAFAVSAARQRHTLALSAVNGAPARQLRRYILGQALVLGGGSAVIAAALGIPAAWAALALARAAGANVPVLPLSAPPLLVGAVVACAVVASLIAAAVPARGLGRLDVVSALRGGAPLAAPRRRTPVVGLALVAAAAAAMFAAAIAMSRQIGGDAMAFVVAGAAVVLAIGTLLVLPALLHWFGRHAGWAPPALRMATRDASRQRSRTVPAMAAVLVTVGVVTAILIVGASSEESGARTYRPQAPSGTAVVVGSGMDTPDLATVRAEATRTLPGSHTALIRDARRAFSGPQGAVGKPARRLAVSPGACPARAAFDWDYADQLAGSPPPGRNGEAPERPCGAATDSSGLMLLDSEGIASLPGLPEPVRATLRDGGIVTTKERFAQAKLLTATVTEHAPPTPGGEAPPPTLTDLRELPSTARVVDPADLASLAGAATPAVVMSAETAASAGVPVAPNAAIVIGADGAPVTLADEARLMDAVAPLGLQVRVERGHTSSAPLAVTIILGVTLLIVLVAALSSTALSLAEQQRDLATLNALGATRRTRRALAAAQAGLIAGAGCLVGMAVGAIPGVALTWPATTTHYNPDTMGMTTVPPTIVIPWPALAALLLVVPAVAAALAALGVRRTPPLIRRLA